MTLGPPYSKAVIDRYVPLFSVILGGFMSLIGITIGTYSGKHTVAGPIIQAFAIDLGSQTSQIANRTAIYGIEPKARNRVNTAYMVSVFCGQLMGTAVGNRLYAEGGWVASGSASVGFVGLGILVALARGPHEKGWIGWSGGWDIKRRDLGRVRQEPAVEEVLDELSAEEGKDNGQGGDSNEISRTEERKDVQEKETSTPSTPSEDVISKE